MTWKSRIPVVVLAAGRGNRLAPLTDELPKCLLPIGPTSPLELLLGSLPATPVREVAIVVGHARERIASFVASRRWPFPIVEVANAEWRERNNIHSAHLVADRCSDGFLLVNSDVVCHPALLERALGRPDESFLVVDESLPPRGEAMKVRFEDGRLTAIGKNLDPGACSGEYVGIAHLDRAGAREFFAEVEALLGAGRTSDWYEAAIGGASGRVPFGRLPVGGLPWIEIDDPEDLARAEREVLPRIRTTRPGR